MGTRETGLWTLEKQGCGYQGNRAVDIREAGLWVPGLGKQLEKQGCGWKQGCGYQRNWAVGTGGTAVDTREAGLWVPGKQGCGD